ncbi:MAG: hypothetical protein HY928_01320 [Elusimicrobia bacterium]|nr:hypothetical protein [Elusimicrobiota bacterium]
MLAGLLLAGVLAAPMAAADPAPPPSPDALDELRDECWKELERLDELLVPLRRATDAFPGKDPGGLLAEHGRLSAEFRSVFERADILRHEHRRRQRALEAAAFSLVSRRSGLSAEDPAVERLRRHERDVNRLRSRKEDVDKRFYDDAGLFAARVERYRDERLRRRYQLGTAAGLAVLAALLALRISARRRA